MLHYWKWFSHDFRSKKKDTTLWACLVIFAPVSTFPPTHFERIRRAPFPVALEKSPVQIFAPGDKLQTPVLYESHTYSAELGLHLLWNQPTKLSQTEGGGKAFYTIFQAAIDAEKCKVHAFKSVLCRRQLTQRGWHFAWSTSHTGCGETVEIFPGKSKRWL